MKKLLNYSSSILFSILIIFILFTLYCSYLLFNKGISLDLLKERIVDKIELNSKINVENISGINLKYSNDKGIFIRIDNIGIKSDFFINVVNIDNSIVDFKLKELLFSKPNLFIETFINFSKNNIYELSFNILVNDENQEIEFYKLLGPDLYLVDTSNFIINNFNKIIIEDALELKVNFKSLNKSFELLTQENIPSEFESLESWTHIKIKNQIDLSKRFTQNNLTINLSGIINFGYLLPDIGQTLSLGQVIGYGASLGVSAVDLEIAFLEKYNQINFNLFTNGNLDLRGSNIRLSKDFNNAEFDLKTNGSYKLSSLFESTDINSDNQSFLTFKRILGENSIETNNINFSFKASNYFERSFIDTISDLKINADANIDINFLSKVNNNPSKLIGRSSIVFDIILEDFSFKNFKSSGIIKLNDLDIFYRPFNLTKLKGDKLELRFDAEMSESFRVKLSSDNDLYIKSEIEITKDRNIIISELLLNNYSNMNLSLSGNIHKRVFNGNVSGELIDFSALKIERKKKNKFFFDQENYEINVKKAILEGPILVNNFSMTINQNKEKLRAKGQASSNGHDLYYLREKDEIKDSSHIKSTDIISFIGENHPFKKIISKGDVNINSTRDSYSEKSLNIIKLNEFTLINTPAALKLLTLPSLSGISNLIENEDGISFLNGEVTYFEEIDSFSNIEMFAVSDSIGLVMEGSINRKDKTLNFDGEISPIHLINMLLKKVPIIGDLLVGDEGEGLFAFEFEMRGDSLDPEVTSNPLSIAKPQILERASQYLQSIE
tara:strand:- start:651 stop:2993 length:2343 start_codon:yes stop_codon:yes gene_type:complete